MKNPEGMILRPVTAEEVAAGAPQGNMLGQFKCPECGTWVASQTVKGVPQSWKATSTEETEPEHAFITDLSPSVNIANDHFRTYPFSQKGEKCPGWHGHFRQGMWVK